MIPPTLRLAVTISILPLSAAEAMFVGNYATWNKLPSATQEAYLAGVMDSWTRTTAPGEPSWMKVQRTGINKCLREQEIHSGALVDLVNSHYKTHTPDWRLSPAVVVKDVVMGACLADVNSEREKAGLPPWERKTGQISQDR
nr:hypothetical protein RTCK_00509 [Rhizobium sp. TCK]